MSTSKLNLDTPLSGGPPQVNGAPVQNGGTLIANPYSFCEMLGGSEPMQNVYDAVRRVAQSNTSVLIRGESGSGKELVAKSIVQLGPRKDKPFISVNCAALPEALIESELFGYEKG